MTEELIKRAIDLVVVGFEANDIKRYKSIIETKNIIKERFDIKKGRERIIPGPPNIPPVPYLFKITNDDLLSIEYNMLEKKLIISQDEYRSKDYYNYDLYISEVLKCLLTLTPASSIIAFGINYRTDLKRQQKLCLFNPHIEEKIGQNTWNTNIGFKTELAFSCNKYTSIYRIFKDEQQSTENSRYYSFDANFDFILNNDDYSAQILDIFKENEKYFNKYEQMKRNILAL